MSGLFGSGCHGGGDIHGEEGVDGGRCGGVAKRASLVRSEGGRKGHCAGETRSGLLRNADGHSFESRRVDLVCLARCLDGLGACRSNGGHNKPLRGKTLALAAALLRAVSGHRTVIVAYYDAHPRAHRRDCNRGVFSDRCGKVLRNDELLRPRANEIGRACGRALLGDEVISLIQGNQGLGVARGAENVLGIVDANGLINGGVQHHEWLA